MKNTIWKGLIARFNFDAVTTRTSLVSLGYDMNTIDRYRRWLEIGGYIEKIRYGIYKRLKYIPINTTVESCKS